LTNNSIVEAEQILAEADLIIKESKEDFHPTIKKGNIINIEPEESEFPTKSSVTLVVSKGIEMVDLPDLKGKTLFEAISILSSRGLKLGKTTRVKSSYDETDMVVSYSPNSNNIVKGSNIDLQTSIGNVTVPNLTGKSLEEAKQLLSKSGLNTGIISKKFTNIKSQVGKVISQSPASGKKELNSKIDVRIGSYIPKEFIFVQGGTFQMGSNSGDSDEKPLHSARVSDFYICKYEVTQAEWQEVMGNNPSKFKGDNNPVEKVSWYDAVVFCNKKSIKDGLEPVYSGSGSNIKCDFTKSGYRLPTEAEWEFAASGGNKSQGYTYSGSNNIGEVAWYRDNSGSKTHAVAGKKANELGIYDMTGNVWEWCWDWYGNYSSSSQSDPAGPTSGSSRAYRGGSWSNSATSCWVARRISSNPTISSTDLGFRVARSSN